MPFRLNYKSDSGSSRWITIGLIALLAVAVVFVAWAVYTTQFGKERSKKISGINEATAPPPLPGIHCPLDGSMSPTADSAEKRPIVVQIDNAPEARPQSGLSQADIVYEAMAEGDVTRFSAIFACHEADTVGPVRSARLINLELAPEYGALLANSGSSAGVTANLEAASDIPNIADTNHPEAFYRSGDRFAPHNLMTSTSSIRGVAANAGFPVTANVPQTLIFKDDKPAPAISTIEIPYSGIVNVSYKYDPATNTWLRSIGGEPHTDALNDRQLAPKNVIVQYVTITASDIVEDEGGNLSLQYTLTGSGKAQIFRDGQKIDAMWKRGSRDAITNYLDTAGNPVPLNRGLTFVQIVPVELTINTA